MDTGILEDAETVERYRQAKYGWLGARTYPYAEHHTLRLATDWCVWLFASTTPSASRAAAPVR